MNTFALFGDVVTPGALLADHYLLIADGIIRSVTHRPPALPAGAQVHRLKGKTIVPGFIDLHIHGIGACDPFAGDPSATVLLSERLAKNGVTGFLPTVCTASPERTRAALAGIADAARRHDAGARVLGIHLEGPFINPKKAGAQEPSEIRIPSVDLMRGYVRAARGMIRIVTCATELDGGARFVRYLKKEGIVPAIGHSDADYAGGKTAIDRGVLYATHLGNAMNGLHHREPGAVMAYLDDPRPYVELIADGVHLHPAFVRLAVRMKGDKAVAVTDALEGLPCGLGSYAFGGRQMMTLRDRYAFPDGTIAGSRLTMNGALKNLIDFTGGDIVSCVKLLTINPVKAAGLALKKGEIRPGYDADIAVIDRKFNVEMTVVEGNIVYRM